MSVLASLLGPLSAIIDKVIPDPAQAAQAKIALLSAEMEPTLAQLDVNKQEAAHRTIFVAGWRPAIGWTCGFILAFNYVIAPMLHWVCILAGADVPYIPTLGLGEMMPVLLGMLGLSTLRTVEKTQKVA